MRNIIYLFFLFVGMLQAQTKMTHKETVALKSKVKSQSELTKTINSDFTQYKHLDFLSNDIVTSGKLKFKAPNLVKWEYVKPFKYAVIFKNENLHINDEGHKSDINLSASKLFKKLNHLIINSVKGDMFNENEFEIQYFKAENQYDVSFIPLNKKIAKYIKEFRILFNVKGEVLQIKMIEPTDDYTRIVFYNRTLNKPIPDALFTH
ncbi:MAG: LolA family protein [Flavobacteriaceae bacterium]